MLSAVMLRDFYGFRDIRPSQGFQVSSEQSQHVDLVIVYAIGKAQAVVDEVICPRCIERQLHFAVCGTSPYALRLGGYVTCRRV